MKDQVIRSSAPALRTVTSLHSVKAKRVYTFITASVILRGVRQHECAYLGARVLYTAIFAHVALPVVADRFSESALLEISDEIEFNGLV